jgi:hypothetical protein
MVAAIAPAQAAGITVTGGTFVALGVRWVEGPVPASPAFPFHPNQRGQQAMARQVLAALGR